MKRECVIEHLIEIVNNLLNYKFIMKHTKPSISSTFLMNKQSDLYYYYRNQNKPSN